MNEQAHLKRLNSKRRYKNELGVATKENRLRWFEHVQRLNIGKRIERWSSRYLKRGVRKTEDDLQNISEKKKFKDLGL